METVLLGLLTAVLRVSLLINPEQRGTCQTCKVIILAISQTSRQTASRQHLFLQHAPYLTE